MIYGRRLPISATAPRKRPRNAPRKRGIPLPEEEDAIAAETSAEPVAKEPDPDLPVAAPEPKAAPRRSPRRPPNLRPRQSRPPKPAPAPAPAPAPGSGATAAACSAARARARSRTGGRPRSRRRVVAHDDQGSRPQGRGDARRTRHHARRSGRGADARPRRAISTSQLGVFTGRMARDRWIDQAKLLASGDTAAYEAEFGKLG